MRVRCVCVLSAGQMVMWFGITQVADIWFVYHVLYLYATLSLMPLFKAMADSFLMMGCICWITTLFPFHNFVGCIVTNSTITACLRTHPFLRGIDSTQTTEDVLRLHEWLTGHILSLISVNLYDLTSFVKTYYNGTQEEL